MHSVFIPPPAVPGARRRAQAPPPRPVMRDALDAVPEQRDRFLGEVVFLAPVERSVRAASHADRRLPSRPVEAEVAPRERVRQQLGVDRPERAGVRAGAAPDAAHRVPLQRPLGVPLERLHGACADAGPVLAAAADEGVDGEFAQPVDPAVGRVVVVAAPRHAPRACAADVEIHDQLLHRRSGAPRTGPGVRRTSPANPSASGGSSPTARRAGRATAPSRSAPSPCRDPPCSSRRSRYGSGRRPSSGPWRARS